MIPKQQLIERYEALTERRRRTDTVNVPIHFMTEVDRRLAETGRSLKAVPVDEQDLPIELDLWLRFQLERSESILATLDRAGTTRVYRYERLYLPTIPHLIMRKLVRLLIRIRARLFGYTADYQTLDLGSALYLRFSISENSLFRYIERIRVTRRVVCAARNQDRS
jgi:hypothetical protein